MIDKTNDEDSMPPVLWWLFGAVAVCFVVMWGWAGLPRTLWWLGLLVAATTLAIVMRWIRDAFEYGRGIHMVADGFSKLSWIAALFVFLFGVALAGKVVVGPLFSGLDEAGHSEDLPQNWRK